MLTDSDKPHVSVPCHILYDEYVPVWDKIADCLAGSTAIKQKREVYLPMTEGMKADSFMGDSIYRRYLHNAIFPEYAQDFFMASTGLLKQKAPALNFPDAMLKEFVPSPSFNANESFYDVYSIVQDEVMKYSRCGVLIDPPNTNYKKVHNYPLLVVYNTYRIINWGTSRYQGRDVVSWILLNESYYDSCNESLSYELKESYRFLGLKLTDAYGNELETPMYYTYESNGGLKGIFNPPAPDENGFAFAEDTVIRYPHINGVYMDHIPFYCFTATRMGLKPERPLTQSLCEACISLYGIYADYREYLYKQGFGLLFGKGFTSDDNIYTGVNKALIVADKDADLKMVESSGSGLAEYRLAIDNAMTYAKSLGLAILKGNGDETGVSVAKRQGFKTASLKSISKTLAEGFVLVAKTAATWAGLSKEDVDSITIDPNTDFSYTANTSDITLYQNVQDSSDPVMSDYDIYMQMRSKEYTTLNSFDEWQKERIRSRQERDKYELDKKIKETRAMNEESLRQEMERQALVEAQQPDATEEGDEDGETEEDESAQKQDAPDAKGADEGDMQKPVRCVETGKRYKSATEAGKDVGVSGSAITRHLRGLSSSAGTRGKTKLHWKYV